MKYVEQAGLAALDLAERLYSGSSHSVLDPAERLFSDLCSFIGSCRETLFRSRRKPLFLYWNLQKNYIQGLCSCIGSCRKTLFRFRRKIIFRASVSALDLVERFLHQILQTYYIQEPLFLHQILKKILFRDLSFCILYCRKIIFRTYVSALDLGEDYIQGPRVI